MLEAVARAGCALKYAGPELQADRDVVAVAIAESGRARGSADWGVNVVFDPLSVFLPPPIPFL